MTDGKPGLANHLFRILEGDDLLYKWTNRRDDDDENCCKSTKKALHKLARLAAINQMATLTILAASVGKLGFQRPTWPLIQTFPSHTMVEVERNGSI
jgi:hypothetical protein